MANRYAEYAHLGPKSGNEEDIAANDPGAEAAPEEQEKEVKASRYAEYSHLGPKSEAEEKSSGLSRAGPLNLDDAVAAMEGYQPSPHPSYLAEKGDKPGSWAALKGGGKQSWNAIKASFNTAVSDNEAVIRNAKDAQGIPRTPDEDEFLSLVDQYKEERGDTFTESIKTVLDAAWEEPKGAYHAVLAQLPNSGTTLAGMYAGAKLGALAGPKGVIVGGVLGMFLGTSLIETGHMAYEKAEDGKVTDDELKAALKEGALKSGVITAVDTFTLKLNSMIGGAPGRALEKAVSKSLADQGVDIANESALALAFRNPTVVKRALEAGSVAFVQSATRVKNLARKGAGVVTESAAEGAGEYLGTMAAGKDPSYTEAVMEAAMSIPQSMIDLVVSREIQTEGELTARARKAEKGFTEEALPAEDTIGEDPSQPPPDEPPPAAPPPDEPPPAPTDETPPAGQPDDGTDETGATPPDDVTPPSDSPPAPEEGPSAYFDSRLNEESYRFALQGLVDDLTPGGGIALVPDPNYIPGEGDKRNDDGSYDIPMVRTPSTNPAWYQEMADDPDYKISVTAKDEAGKTIKKANGKPRKLTGVAAVQQLVRDALNGKTDFGVRQKRILDALLSQIEEGEQDRYGNSDADLEAAQQARVESGMPDAPDWLFEEQDYPDDYDGQHRTFMELLEEAEGHGKAIADQVRKIMDSPRDDDVLLDEIIELLRNDAYGQEIEAGFEGQQAPVEEASLQGARREDDARGQQDTQPQERPAETAERQPGPAEPEQEQQLTQEDWDAAGFAVGDKVHAEGELDTDGSKIVFTIEVFVEDNDGSIMAELDGPDGGIYAYYAYSPDGLAKIKEEKKHPGRKTPEDYQKERIELNKTIMADPIYAKKIEDILSEYGPAKDIGMDIRKPMEPFSLKKLGKNKATNIKNVKKALEVAKEELAKDIKGHDAIREQGLDAITDPYDNAEEAIDALEVSLQLTKNHVSSANAQIKWAEIWLKLTELGHDASKGAVQAEFESEPDGEKGETDESEKAEKKRPAEETAEEAKPEEEESGEESEKNIGGILNADQMGQLMDEREELFMDRDTVSHPRRIKGRVDKNEYISQEEADAKLESWRENAISQGEYGHPARMENATKVVLSLFDESGVIARPWAEAGYQVWTADLDANDIDINNLNVQYFMDQWGDFEGNEVYAILAQPPCTHFSLACSRLWKDKDADGRTEAAIELVKQTLRTIEYFRPRVWALENPLGRIREEKKSGKRLTDLPKPHLLFDPHHFGDDYTKRTQLFGKFNANLPTANVFPKRGSLIHKLRGDDPDQKKLRSLTPEGFAYAFFQANNAHDNFDAKEDLEHRMRQAETAGDDALYDELAQELADITGKTQESFEGEAKKPKKHPGKKPEAANKVKRIKGDKTGLRYAADTKAAMEAELDTDKWNVHQIINTQNSDRYHRAEYRHKPTGKKSGERYVIQPVHVKPGEDAKYSIFIGEVNSKKSQHYGIYETPVDAENAVNQHIKTGKTDHLTPWDPYTFSDQMEADDKAVKEYFESDSTSVAGKAGVDNPQIEKDLDELEAKNFGLESEGEVTPDEEKEKRDQTDMFAEPESEEEAEPEAEAEAQPDTSSETYSNFDGKTITYEVSVERSGESFTVDADAGKLMRSLDSRISAMKKLLGCIK